MACNTCPIAKPVPACATDLEIATTSLISTDVYVYFRSTSTGRLERFEATTDLSGVITLPTPELALNTSYEVYATDQIDTDQSNRIVLTLDLDGTDTEVECYLLRFDNPQAGDFPLITVVLNSL